jgi:hypothetical protein
VLIAGMAVMVAATAGGPLLSFHANTAAAGRWLLGLTPPFLTAVLVAGGSSVDSWVPITGLAVWVCGAGATLGALERLPRVSRARPGAAAMWDDVYDRVTAAFGSPAGPLLGKTLRSYFRSAHLRLNYAFVVPLLTVMWWMQSGQSRDDRFAVALASMSLVGFASMGGMPLNVFGFDRSGFRRYFLLPVAPAVVVRVVALVPMLLGAFQVIAALAAWMLLESRGWGPRALAMLASAGIGGLALMSTGALWASVLAPRPIDPDVVFGNKLSPPANAVLIGMFVVFAGILFAVRGRGVAELVRVWWIVPLGAAGACALLGGSLAIAPRVFVARRERALGLIEGRA